MHVSQPACNRKGYNAIAIGGVVDQVLTTRVATARVATRVQLEGEVDQLHVHHQKCNCTHHNLPATVYPAGATGGGGMSASCMSTTRVATTHVATHLQLNGYNTTATRGRGVSCMSTTKVAITYVITHLQLQGIQRDCNSRVRGLVAYPSLELQLHMSQLTFNYKVYNVTTTRR